MLNELLEEALVGVGLHRQARQRQEAVDQLVARGRTRVTGEQHGDDAKVRVGASLLESE